MTSLETSGRCDVREMGAGASSRDGEDASGCCACRTGMIRQMSSPRIGESFGLISGSARSSGCATTWSFRILGARSHTRMSSSEVYLPLMMPRG